jgi:hypothetical protein
MYRSWFYGRISLMCLYEKAISRREMRKHYGFPSSGRLSADWRLEGLDCSSQQEDRCSGKLSCVHRLNFQLPRRGERRCFALRMVRWIVLSHASTYSSVGILRCLSWANSILPEPWALFWYFYIISAANNKTEKRYPGNQPTKIEESSPISIRSKWMHLH